MFVEFLTFELRYRLKRLSTHVYFAVMFGLAFTFLVGASGVIHGWQPNLAGLGTGSIYLNASYCQ